MTAPAGPRRVLAYAEAALPARYAAQVAGIEAAAWPGAAPGHDPALAPRVLLLVDPADTVLASLALLFKELEHGGRRLRAAGLSSVAVRPDARGRGHGLRVVRAAHAALAAEPGLDLALFSCDRALVPFYERASFQVLPGTVLVGGTPEEPLATDAPGFDKAVLAGCFGPGTAPADFAGTRIGLYPGTRDRLW
ncbi:GNAT family N-acetyltransferase [Streptomyces antimicrobicus]|uniref:GNAT family N-acetyltransferase n=1 Tax=Streptomyces antimicrobicus TaxID=2883108 RepID=A0ABS8BDT5_9ACTN|nr:GNAT family N-acetyltransferase [Streptomyces antimicrobicus]MCB5182770.1 GNAT family N-acetyltransferase [Streptomyces antimicrobicus]